MLFIILADVEGKVGLCEEVLEPLVVDCVEGGIEVV